MEESKFSEEEVERLLVLCHELSEKMDRLEKEGHTLFFQLRQAIDKEKIKKVSSFINKKS